MRFNIPHKRRILCTAVSLSLFPLATQSYAQDDPEVEEVVVTGSYIRRSEGFTAASQVTQLNADDLADTGMHSHGGSNATAVRKVQSSCKLGSRRPSPIVPRSVSSNAAYAGQIVNIFNAWTRVTASSGCQPSPEKPFWSLRATAA